MNNKFKFWLCAVFIMASLVGCSSEATPTPETVGSPSPTIVAHFSPSAAVSLPPAAATETSPPRAPSVFPITPTPPLRTEVTFTPVGPTGLPAMPAAGTEMPTASSERDNRFGAVFFTRQVNTVNLPCEEMEWIGIGNTFLAAWWGQIESVPGQYDWSFVDEPVDAALACGLEPVLKVTTGEAPGIDGVPPDDMDAYAGFIYNLAKHLEGRVSVYAIENEVNNPRMVWTADTYGALRAVAHDAIKRADPKAQVFDGGLTMEAYVLARANELVEAGLRGEALALADRFETYMRRTPKRLPDNEQELDRWLRRPYTRRVLGLVDELYDNLDTVDGIQLHYLQDAWELMPEYVGWVRSWMDEAGTAGMPVEFWEIGFGWEGEESGIEFTEELHAAGVVKTLVTALGEGASRVIYEPYREPPEPGNTDSRVYRKVGRGLIAPEGPRQAATAHQTMVEHLSGYTGTESLSLGSGIWGYRFTVPEGDIFVVWASQDTQVSLPIADEQIVVTEITGAAFAADAASVPIDTNPVFIRPGDTTSPN